MAQFFSYVNLAITRLKPGSGTPINVTPVQPPADTGIYKNVYNSVYK